MSTQPAVLTINARGQIKGGLELLSETERAEYLKPEMQAKLRDMYKSAYGSGRRETRRPIQWANEGERREIVSMCPSDMSRKEFRRSIKRSFHKRKKQAIREQRSITNG